MSWNETPSDVAIALEAPPSANEIDPLSALVEQAYSEFCDRRQKGEVVDRDEFCGRFPAFKSLLRPLVDAHSFLKANLSLLNAGASGLAADPAPEAADAPIRWPQRGETFGKYHLLLELGRGTFARVFLAAEPKLGDRLVAIKIALPGNAEPKILGPIKHPNIVPVLSLDEDEATGLTAVCMPYLGGSTLCHVLTTLAQHPRDRARLILNAVRTDGPAVEKPIDAVTPTIWKNGTYVDGVRFIGAQLADALAYIHQRGILHLDLKPSNVLLSQQGVPMLFDFNLSANRQEVSDRIGGTLNYMSPEHLYAAAQKDKRDAPALDARADIFSLGVLLYELVTRKLPFEIDALRPIPVLCGLLRERQRAGPAPVRAMNPDVDKPFAEFIESCLAFAPEDRPASAAAAARQLRDGLAPQKRAQRWLGRHPRTALAVLFAGLLAFSAPFLRPPYSERQFTAGVEAYRQGKFEKAVTHFNEALGTDKNFAAAYFARGRAHQQLGTAENDRSALADYELADRADGRAQACIGYCLNRTGQELLHAAASDHYQEAIAAGYATAEVYNNLGYCHLKMRQWKQAEQNLDRAIQLDRRLQAAFHNRALASLHQTFDHSSRLQQARQQPGIPPLRPDEQKKIRAEMAQWLSVGIADIKKALEIGPSSAELLYDAARLYALAAQEDPAQKANALRHLATGIEKHNLDPRRLQDPWLAPLHNDPKFKELSQRKRASEPSEPQPTARFVDPVKDLAP